MDLRSALMPTLFLTPLLVWSQPFAIGSRSITFTDPARGGRSIPCDVHYPAQSAGANAPFASGAFPVLAFGHGFVMTTSAYANLWQAYVPQGFILVLPNTETGILPDHEDLGLDLAFVIHAMQQEGAAIASPYFGHVAGTSAVMGHSMGGGASFLAAASDPTITTMVTYAAAETNPSAIAAAATVTIPTLVMNGSSDCVAPPNDNQLPMYAALASGCKAYVSITGGGHCYFANNNFNCSLGEATCGGPGQLTRAQQQDAAQDMTLLWLRRQLLGDTDAGDGFADSLASSPRITAQSGSGGCPPPVIAVQLRALLDGPYDATLHRMHDDLRALGLVPLMEPNSAAGFVQVSGGAGEMLDAALLSATGEDAIVDWVFLELRDAMTGAQVIATANALVQSDGDIVDPNGGIPTFQAGAGEYRIAVRHRNHLGVMSASVGLSSVAVPLDLSDPLTPVYGMEARRLRDGHALLWCGNTLRDDHLRYAGADNDRDPILLRIGGMVPTAVLLGYHAEDANLDGNVRYAGAGNDRDRLLQAIGGAVPTDERLEQLP
ncbi:MAG: hypothetical protein H6594_03305 [Flavobacteriales bacterium]|nr:hypothetical protein [Flavobacteriales bacterium]